MNDINNKIRSVLNRDGYPKVVIELRPPDETGQPQPFIVEVDKRLSAFTVAMMLHVLVTQYMMGEHQHIQALRQRILTEGKAVMDERLEEQLLDGGNRWDFLEHRREKPE